jgi:murein DD-endopeptidase MepM/ murein hydrolase activator NlpD
MNRLPILVVFCLAASLTFGQGRAGRKHPRSASQLRGALSGIKHQKAVIRHQLAQTKHQANVVQYDIHALDKNLVGLEASLDKTTSSLHSSRSEQVMLSGQLKEATARVVVVKEQVRRRLRYMYMHEGESVLTAFVGAKSVGEIASRKMVLQAIAEKDRSLFNEYRRLQARIDDRKHRQDQVVLRIADLKHRQLDYQSQLVVTRGHKKIALNNLKDKQKDLQALLYQLESDEASVYSQIQAYEAARRAAARVPGAKAPPVFIGRFLKPASGPIVSGFGMRFHPILHRTRLHAGVDFGAPYGSPIRAAGDGIVISARYSQSFGNMVVIDHGNGLSTLYAHASRLMVHEGMTVRRGQVIAAVGSTGLATGPHLHWEVRINGRPVNPLGRF